MQLATNSLFYSYLSYGLLYFSIISLWMPRVKQCQTWTIFFTFSVIFGLVSHILEFAALIPLVLLLVAVYSFKKNEGTALRVAVGLCIIVIGIGLAMHLFPGFNNLTAVVHAQISPDAIPYSMSLNFDKAVVGIFILGMLIERIVVIKAWLSLAKQISWMTPLIVMAVVILALLMGFVRFEPKISNYFVIWCATNLLFVCTAEEAFFRGFIQKNLGNAMRKVQYGDCYAIFIASVLFGLAHFAGGMKYVILATFAGLGYGWIYHRTKRIEASILTHFSLNLTHFIFFTYPMLASVASK
jgi:membrane protease YdiL (CAAX protease family)